MTSTLQHREKETSWQKKHDPHAPKLGERAPDFELHDITGENAVRLSDFRGRIPVVLIFGSFT